MSGFSINVEGDYKNNTIIECGDVLEIIDTKLKTAKEARSKKSNGSSSWEFWNGKIRAYEEIKNVIEKESG